MKRKLIKVSIAFLMLVPFRLTISVLLLKLFTLTATIGTENLPNEIILASVITSKICYDLFVGIYLLITLYSIYDKIGTNKYDNQEDWVIPATIMSSFAVIAFIISDIYLTNKLFWHLTK